MTQTLIGIIQTAGVNKTGKGNSKNHLKIHAPKSQCGMLIGTCVQEAKINSAIIKHLALPLTKAFCVWVMHMLTHD